MLHPLNTPTGYILLNPKYIASIDLYEDGITVMPIDQIPGSQIKYPSQEDAEEAMNDFYKIIST